MVTIKIEIGFDRKDDKKNISSDMKKTVLLAALLDSMVWMADTAFMLKFFYSIPLYPFGMFFITGMFILYFAYLIMKAQLLTQKYGKQIYREKFGHTGILLAAVSAVILFFFIAMSYV